MKLHFVQYLFILFLFNINILSAQPGSALNFDGVNDYVSIPHNSLLKPSTGITIEAWVKPIDIHSNTYNEIYRKEDGNSRHLFSFQNYGTVLSFGLEIAGVYSELHVPIVASNYENQWVHIAATYDGSAKAIYRNGILIGTQNVSGLIGTTGTAPALIGSYGGGAEFFNGSIDEFKLWSRGLTQSDIQTNMNCETSGTQNGLLAYYKFNQGSTGVANSGIATLIDSSGNNIDGSLINFGLSGINSNWVAPGGVKNGSYCTFPSPGIYTFNGNGNWSDSTNWLDKNVPPDILMDDAEIIIDPVGGECILDISQYLSAGVKLTIASGKKLRILKELQQLNDADSFTMSIDDINFLDSIAADPSEITLFKPLKNTLGVQGKNDEIVNSMISYAQQLCAQKSNGTSPLKHEKEPGDNRPEHYGLAYRYGGGGKDDNKNITDRLKPTMGDDTHKMDFVFGTDCEGFLINLIRHAGIKITPVGAVEFAWKFNKQLQQNSNAQLSNIRVDSLGHIDGSKFKKGDIIQWKNRLHHIGIVFIDAKQKIWIYNSNGNPKPETNFDAKCGSACQQKKNRGDKRGVHAVDFLDPFWLGMPNWKNTYEIFRLANVDIMTNTPTVTNETSAVSGGTFTYSGENQIIDRGVCWSKKNKPTTKDFSKSEGAGNIAFSSNLSNLEKDVLYFVKAYVTIRNSASDQGITYYGNEVSFNTSINQNIHLQGSYSLPQYYTQSFSLAFDLNLQNATGTMTVPEGQYPATLSINGSNMTCTSIFDYTYQTSGPPYTPTTDHRTYVFSGQLNGHQYSGDVNLTVEEPGGTNGGTQTTNYQGTFAVQ